MAPRGRSRKAGLRRIDAAVDALRPLGFSKDLVCKTVKSLLRVYDHDSGWVFIEEASYKLVIETILEQQEVHAKEEEEEQEDTQQVDGAKAPEDCEPDRQLKSAAEDGNVAKVDENCEPLREPQAEVTTAGANSGQTNISCMNPRLSGESCSTSTVTGMGAENRESFSRGGSFLQTTNNYSRPRRPPCYGWISENEEDEEENDASATGISQTEQVFQTTACSQHKRKYKTGWDVKPSNI